MARLKGNVLLLEYAERERPLVLQIPSVPTVSNEKRETFG
jgi:hypothetical protein